MRHGAAGPNRNDAVRFGLELTEQSLQNDEVCDQGPAATSTSIENVQTPRGLKQIRRSHRAGPQPVGLRIPDEFRLAEIERHVALELLADVGGKTDIH